MAIGLIDIGGTSIKFGIWAKTAVHEQHAVATPQTLSAFLTLISNEVAAMKETSTITGVGISTAGVVDVTTGIISGAGAADYTHGRPLISELTERFGVPVSIENDANCAALGEATYGAAKGISDVVVLVIGTGVGGAVILDGRVRHGAHLLGGEFGYMLTDAALTVSRGGTAVNMALAYSADHPDEVPVSGRDLFDRAAQGDSTSAQYLQRMNTVLARTIFNLQYSIDPTCLVLAGGVSANPAFLPGVSAALDDVMTTVAIAPVRPDVRIAQFRNDANLVGAAVHYLQQHA